MDVLRVTESLMTDHPTLRVELGTQSDEARPVRRKAATPKRETTINEHAIGNADVAKRDDALLRWLFSDPRGGAAGAVERLGRIALAQVCELGDLTAFERGQDVLAYTLLDEFARARGLRLGELATLMVEPAVAGRASVQKLMMHFDEAVIAVARINRAIDIRKRGEEDPSRRRDRGQVRRV